MLWVWNVNMERPITLGAGGSLYAESIEDVLDQAKLGILEQWGAEPIYTGEPIAMRIMIEGKRAR